MTQPLIIKNTITIHAPIHRVWDALVNPEKTKIYMYGCEAISEWSPGSSLLWKGQQEEKEMIFVKGHIVEIHSPYTLIYTVFDPNTIMEDIPQNYLNVTYQLQEDSDQTILTVIQDGFETAAWGQERYIDASNGGMGWNPVLTAIKNLVESEYPLPDSRPR